MIKEINNKLNYKLNLKDRLSLLKEIEIEYGEELAEKYFYYKTSNLNRLENQKAYDEICKLYDKMSEYILLCSDVPKDVDYPYTKESNSSPISSPDEISLESYMHSISTKEKYDKKHYDEYNHAKYKIKDFIKDVDRFPEIMEYIVYGDMVRGVILNYERKLKQYERLRLKLLKKNLFNRLDQLENIWNSYLYCHHDHNGRYFKRCINIEQPFVYDTELDRLRINYNHLTYIQYINTLKNATGYKKNNLAEIDKDIITVYKELAGLIYFKSPLRGVDVSTRKCRHIDFFDPEHVKAVFKGMCLRGISNEFDVVLDKLDRILEKLHLTFDEQELVGIYKRGRGIEISFEEEMKKRPERRRDFTINIMTFTECAELMNTAPQNIERIVNKLAKNISDYYVEWYENNVYYMDLVRGKYKICSRCGKIKIANENYFGKHPETKDGLQSVCKICDNLRKNH